MRILISLIALCLVLTSCKGAGQTGIGPGEFAPDFELQELAGKPTKLSSYRGKVVLLNFWASWCEPCIAEMPELEQLQKSLGGKDFEVVSVAVQDNPQRLQELRDQMKLSFAIALDTKGEIRDRYKVNGYPETFVLDREGKVVLFPDPQTSDPRTRIIGPRSWSAPQFVERLKLLF